MLRLTVVSKRRVNRITPIDPSMCLFVFGTGDAIRHGALDSGGQLVYTRWPKF